MAPEPHSDEFRKTLRRARGPLSQREFGIRIGVTEQAVSRWERGDALPRGVGIRLALEREGVAVPGTGRAPEDGQRIVAGGE